MIGSLVLRIFGIKDPPPPPAPGYRCPTCGHVRVYGIRQDPTDAYLNGASLEYLESAVEHKLRTQVER